MSDQTRQSKPPVRFAYRHLACGKTTIMTPALAIRLTEKPELLKQAYCVKCESYFSLSDGDGNSAFRWTIDDVPVGE